MSLRGNERIRVLHVDDDPQFTDLTATLLERDDDRFVIETATSAGEGLEMIEDGHPDCVVSDYNMPGMDGLELLEAIRDEHPDLPFILFTGKGSESVASDAISAGVTDYLQKASGTERYELLANRIRNAVQSRRTTRRAARQKELMRLTEFAGDTGSFELNPETGDIIITDGARRILGARDRAELTLESSLEFFRPEDRTEIVHTIARVHRTGEKDQAVWPYRHPDGDQRLLEVTYTPTVEREMTVLWGIIRDITEQRERQHELKQIETLFRHAQDPLFLINVAEEFTIKRVNPAWQEAIGLPADSVRGQTPRELLGEQHGKATEEKYSQCVQRREPLQYEEEAELAGEVRQWKTKIAPVVVEDTVEYLVGSSRDITEQKEREQALEDQYQYLFEEAPIMAVVTRAENGRPIIEDCNQLFVEATGYEKAEILGRRLEEFYAGESRQRLLDGGGYDRALSGEFVREDRTLVTAEGEHIETLLRAVPRPRADTDGTLAFYVDISQRKQLKRKKDRLEEFTSIVSHDLRNPLTVAQGQLELAQEDCESDRLARAADAVERSQTLIEDLLTLAREGEAVTEVEPIELKAVAKRGWRTVDTGSATVEVDGGRVIEADSGRLQQLFENVYRNAVEHGGEAVTVTVGEMPDGFYIADSGSGIPEVAHDEVFEVGYSTVEDGTGFGLRIVEQIADAHGWEIAITDSEAGGARIEITGVEPVG